VFRTLVVKDGIVYGQGGAGIVYDSDPLSEYKETMTKMMGGLRAVFRAEAYGGVKVDFYNYFVKGVRVAKPLKLF
jgi:chorismate binding enzyme